MISELTQSSRIVLIVLSVILVIIIAIGICSYIMTGPAIFYKNTCSQKEQWGLSQSNVVNNQSILLSKYYPSQLIEMNKLDYYCHSDFANAMYLYDVLFLTGKHSKGTPDDLAISPDGMNLAVATDYAIYFYSTETYSLKLVIPLGLDIRQIKFSPDGKYLAISTVKENHLYLLDINSGQLFYLGNDSYLLAEDIDFSKRNYIAADSSYTDEVRLWDLSYGTISNFYGGADEIWSVAFSPDGTNIASTALYSISGYSAIYVWSIFSEHEPFAEYVTDQDNYRSAIFSSDGSYVFIGSTNGSVYTWDIHANTINPILKNLGGINKLLLSEDGKYLAVVNPVEFVIYDLSKNELIGPIEGSIPVFSPDGTKIIYFDDQQTINFYDISKKRPIGIIPGFKDIKELQPVPN